MFLETLQTMAKFNDLTDKLYKMFGAYGYDFKMYNIDGNGIANPYTARYFYINSPNFMVIVDEEQNKVEIHKAPIDIDKFKKIFKSVLSICRYHAVKLDIKNYNSKIVPKDFSSNIEKQKYKKEKRESILETKHLTGLVNSITIFTEDKDGTQIQESKLNFIDCKCKKKVDSIFKSSTIKPLTIQIGKNILNMTGITFEEACDKLLKMNIDTHKKHGILRL